MKKLLPALIRIFVVTGPIVTGAVAPSLHGLMRVQASSQTRASSPEFDVASIVRNQTGETGVEGSGRISIQTTPGALTMRNVTVMSCLRWAYDVHDYQISGPRALNAERYHITAKAAAPVGDDQLKMMLRALLAERFKLTYHLQRKELPAYALIVGKGWPTLRASKGTGPSAMREGRLRGEFEHTSMWELAGFLSGLMQTPVLDRTGLEGRYDFIVDLASLLPANGDSGTSKGSGGLDMAGLAIIAVQEQLGLRLKLQKALLDVLIVDHVESPTKD